MKTTPSGKKNYNTLHKPNTYLQFLYFSLNAAKKTLITFSVLTWRQTFRVSP